MFQLALILLGNDFVKRQWWWLAGMGFVWAISGVAIFVDAVGRAAYFPVHPFGYLVLIAVAITLLLSGGWLLRRAIRLARRPEHVSMAALLSKDLPAASPAMRSTDATQVTGLLVVHVWTPISLAGEMIPNPLLDRYIAAVDIHGTVSTGHAALECTPDIYVSHQPAVEIDPSSASFLELVGKDVAGTFEPSYEVEAAGWCDSTAHVVFDHFDRARLASFWDVYRQDTTYNLAHRNCSSSVAHCLEAALEGSLGADEKSLVALFRVIFNPELWYAAQRRKCAQAMTWTPGLVLDYAQALQAAMTRAPVGWESLLSGMRRSWRYGVDVFAARVSRQGKAARYQSRVTPRRKDDH
ncbi:hypothetical protein [Dyella nitratireducens]|uniref:DUF308 domain-containing protein n=1 Tax=Dyella nitratireducens TaxID=1849580 RepID=A0ABQ1FLF0_9GAMM|nr:hypothetical protein [Dyella nitratireducens]GGA19929.1 hypothetical protein GCM10010981_04940 [Dyella nitratireducens]GLQ44444.1 hypothetical protein GCM10007902_42940 [Dyella nitratireducens]